MSKRWMMVGALALLCAAPTAALAGAESRVTLRLGSESPTGPFREVASSGAMAGLSAGFRAIPWLESGVDLGYFNSASVRNGETYGIIEPTTGNPVSVTLTEHWTITQFGLYSRAFIFERGRLGPFLRAGAATYTVRISQDVQTSSATTTVGGNEQVSKFGLSGGVGVRYVVAGGTSIGVEAVYHHIFARDTDVSFTAIGATLGFGSISK
ncbi:MAG TPA: outer membrane beta-barrel protein [Terriglobales bacterium]|nr:outer membrane beta-barrel protein [Terriglobales bacterium]